MSRFRGFSFFCVCAIVAASLFYSDRAHSQGEVSTGRRAGDVKIATIAGIPTRFRWLPPGELTISEYPCPRKERIATGFWLAETETTRRLWNAVMSREPLSPRPEGEDVDGLVKLDDDLPVTNVSLLDCREFIDRISAGSVDGRFSLPTGTQLEYARRSGSTAERVPDENEMNCAESGNGAPTPVGSYSPNARGLRDVYGNVSELLSDWSVDYSSPDGVKKICFGYSGGDFTTSKTSCGSAGGSLAPNASEEFVGFRLVLNEVEYVDANVSSESGLGDGTDDFLPEPEEKEGDRL